MPVQPAGSAVAHGYYENAVCRLVETQEQAATMALVDNLDEQAELEAILDVYKPPYRQGTAHRHYLIATPFRYPPLYYGSRWGTRAERSFFYACESEHTCFSEAAFYRFAFCEGKATPFTRAIVSQHMLFFVDVRADKTADLTTVDDEDLQRQWRDPCNYSVSQQWGKHLRERDTQVIRYFSARCEAGVNVAIDDPDAIVSDKPFNTVMVNCETDAGQQLVRFSKAREFPQHFQRSQFLVDGAFPSLA